MTLGKTLMFGGWTLGLAMMVGTGCSSETDITPTGPLYPDENSFCKAAGEAVCGDEVVNACYRSSAESLSDDKLACRAKYQQSIHCNPGDYDYHHEGSEACLAKLKAVYSNAILELSEFIDVNEICLATFNNGGAAGATCNVDADCDVGAGLSCIAKGGMAGQCQEPEVVGGGLNCGGANQTCEDDFYCDISRDPNICVGSPGPGSATPCSDAVPCNSEAFCVIAPMMTEGSCVAKFSGGQPCTQNIECSGGFCIIATGAMDGTCGGSLRLSPTEGTTCDPFL